MMALNELSMRLCKLTLQSMQPDMDPNDIAKKIRELSHKFPGFCELHKMDLNRHGTCPACFLEIFQIDEKKKD